MNSRLRRLALVLLAALCLLATASCAAQSFDRPWAYADLRRLDPVDAATPATDILAAYTRTTRLTLDLRIDLLDINTGDNYALRLSLWDNRDFYNDPLIVDISSTGAVHTAGGGDGKPVIWPRVVQDRGLDTITVSLNRFLLGERFHFDLATYTTDPASPADEVLDVRSDAQPPADRAPLLLAFWDDFPATTPAQALRRWDGAHTGPYGGRHGLRLLLDSAERYHVPVTLLDIKTPAGLAALNFTGNLSKLRALNEQGLALLPDVAYSRPVSKALDFSRRAASGFGLPLSQFVYSATSNPIVSEPDTAAGYRAQFLPLSDSSHITYSDGMRLIPLPAADALEATADGPSLEARRALMAVALSPDPSDLVVLGGSLPHSAWGDVDMVYPTFAWIAAHPWVQPLDGNSLMSFPAKTSDAPFQPGTPETSPWLDDLNSAPDNPITTSAWQAYLTLTAPAADAQLQALQAEYLGQVGELLAAARWAEEPAPRADCTDDLDADGQAECILADQTYFAVIDPAGARLTNFFYLDESGPHQLVGPSSQFTVGLSDPSEWELGSGEAADPSVIPGAFADATDTWVSYTPSFTAEGITFTSPDGSRVKAYQLLERGIAVRYQVPGPLSTRAPLAVDPQKFYFEPISYQPSLAPHSWTWVSSDGNGVEVRTEATLTAQGFTSAVPFLALPEDPNLDYPRGNYYPFPLSVVTIQGEGIFTVQIIHK